MCPDAVTFVNRLNITPPTLDRGSSMVLLAPRPLPEVQIEYDICTHICTRICKHICNHICNDTRSRLNTTRQVHGRRRGSVRATTLVSSTSSSRSSCTRPLRPSRASVRCAVELQSRGPEPCGQTRHLPNTAGALLPRRLRRVHSTHRGGRVVD